MTEQLLQFIWALGYFNKAQLTTVQGSGISVVHPGSWNKNQGPDFSNARIRLDGTLLAGTVELHVKTSDWRRHGHEADPHYGNVVLHVVFQHDEVVNDIPVLELEPRISVHLLSTYGQLMEQAPFIACQNRMGEVNELTWSAWKDRLLVERLQYKSAYVLSLFEQSNHSWEETFWWLLAHAMGGKINSSAFESIARSLPLKLLAKHKNVPTQIEALLLGQAGLLIGDFTEDYPVMLQREYAYLKQKYRSEPIKEPIAFLRMRPGSFPTIRLAQLASLLHQSHHLFSKVLEAINIAGLKELFSVQANDYWHYHYLLDKPSPYKIKKLGENTLYHLVINTLSPIVFAYGVYMNKEDLKEKALSWLTSMPPEQNNITRQFADLGVGNKTAADSQSLLQLHKNYCSQKHCLNCSVGVSLLREAATRYNVTTAAQ